MSNCHRDDAERWLLIRVKYAYPAFRAHIERWRGKEGRLSREELAQLVSLAFRFFFVSTQLLEYVDQLGGPSPN